MNSKEVGVISLILVKKHILDKAKSLKEYWNDPRKAFNQAISEKRLSVNPQQDNYAGHYMYMGTQNGRDLFKHSLTRQYIK